MKNTIKILFTVAVLFFTACEDFLDVNENPNRPTSVSDYLILPAAQASMVNVMSGNWGILGGFWSQHWAQNNTSSQYKVLETYTLSGNTVFVDFSYTEFYEGALSDNEIILRQAEEEENWGLYLICAVQKAYVFQYMTDLFGTIPYDDAFKGETDGIFNADLNTGEEIYASIYALLNNALSKDMSGFSAVTYETGDIIGGGDLDTWVAFANSLKLRILLRQYAANTSFVETELTSLLANGNFISTDILFDNFEDADSKSNPLYEGDQRQLNTSNNIRGNHTLISYLISNSDTRIASLFVPEEDQYIGMVTGSYEEPSTHFEAPGYVCQPVMTPTMAANLMTVAESEFLQAEAYLRLGNAAQAQAHYEAGVLSSYARMGADATDALTSYAWPAGADAQLEAIIMQKWVDCADGQRGIESYLEWVRTGIPATSAVSAAMPAGTSDDVTPEIGYVPGTLVYSKKGTTSGRFPVRLPYPDPLVNYNSNAASLGDQVDATVMQQKVWWNK